MDLTDGYAWFHCCRNKLAQIQWLKNDAHLSPHNCVRQNAGCSITQLSTLLRVCKPFVRYQSCGPFWRLWASTSSLVQAVGQIQHIAVVGLRSLFPCWLLARGQSQIIEAAHIPWLMASIRLQRHQWQAESFSHSITPTLPPWLPLSHFFIF